MNQETFRSHNDDFGDNISVGRVLTIRYGSEKNIFEFMELCDEWFFENLTPAQFQQFIDECQQYLNEFNRGNQ